MDIENILIAFDEYRETSDPSMGISDEQAEWVREFLRETVDNFNESH